MASIESSAGKLSAALDTCGKKVDGLSSQAMNAAAAASIALGQKGGVSYPVDYIRQRVSILLAELEDLERIASELHDEPRSTTARLIGMLRRESATQPGTHKKAIESRLAAYGASRGSGTEWRRPSSASIRRAG